MTSGEEEHPWRFFKQDLLRYGGWSAFAREQSLWAVAWYRLGRGISFIRFDLIRKPLTAIWWIAFRFIEAFTGVSLPLGAKIGPGIRVWHFGGVFVNSGAVLGKNCTLRQGVTIGSRTGEEDIPVIGDDVEFGAYAQVLGSVSVGDKARIGAMTLVIHDVPAGYTAVGIPATARPTHPSSECRHALS